METKTKNQSGGRKVAKTIGISVAFILITSDKSPAGSWDSPDGQAAYKVSYLQLLRQRLPPTATQDLPTSYGSVRVYAWQNGQPESLIPVILILDCSSGVLMWAENLPELTRHFTVYSFDILGDAGFSVRTQPVEKIEDQNGWISEALNQRDAEKYHLVGTPTEAFSLLNSRHSFRSRYTRLP